MMSNVRRRLKKMVALPIRLRKDVYIRYASVCRMHALLLAVLLAVGCSAPSNNPGMMGLALAVSGGIQEEQIKLTIPEFSAADVLASADEETKQQLIRKAVAIFSSALKQNGIDAQHLGESRFDLKLLPSAPASRRAIIPTGQVDISEWTILDASATKAGPYSHAVVSFKTIALAIYFTPEQSGSHQPNAIGGTSEALEFIEACEVLGVKVTRAK
jgi:hypothetical protein